MELKYAFNIINFQLRLHTQMLFWYNHYVSDKYMVRDKMYI
jgi:hypothetical protein